MRKLTSRRLFWPAWRAKYNKLPFLSKYLRRNMLPFSERQSPPLKTGRSKFRNGGGTKFPQTPRRIIDSAREQNNEGPRVDLHIAPSNDDHPEHKYGRDTGISEDNTSFVPFASSPTKNHVHYTNYDGSVKLSNIEARRPLHEGSSSYSPPQNWNVISRSCKSPSTKLCQKHSNAPYNMQKEESKSTDSEDDAVQFVRELKPDNRNKTEKVQRIQLKKSKTERKPQLEEASSSRKHDIEKWPFFKSSSTQTNQDALSTDDCLVIDEQQCNGSNLQDVSMQSSISNIESDDDVVVVSGDHSSQEKISFPTLKRIVTAVINHYAEENNCEDISVQYVLNRLKSLHNRDFSDRFTEVEYCTRRALNHCQRGQTNTLFKEVRPGVRHMDIDTLSSDNWLNDVIINEYMMLLATEQESCGAVSSFWYDELLKGKEPNLPYYWKKKSYILAPICTDSHWSLLCFKPSSCNMYIYSSLAVTQKEFHCAKELHDFFRRKIRIYDRGKCVEVPGLPHQENEYDCGVYVCMFARCIACGNSYKISPQQVLEFRDWLKREIVTERLLGTCQSDSDDDTSSEASHKIVVDS